MFCPFRNSFRCGNVLIAAGVSSRESFEFDQHPALEEVAPLPLSQDYRKTSKSKKSAEANWREPLQPTKFYGMQHSSDEPGSGGNNVGVVASFLSSKLNDPLKGKRPLIDPKVFGFLLG